MTRINSDNEVVKILMRRDNLPLEERPERQDEL